MLRLGAKKKKQKKVVIEKKYVLPIPVFESLSRAPVDQGLKERHCRLLDSSHPDWRVMVPHCGFDLHFSDNE